MKKLLGLAFALTLSVCGFNPAFAQVQGPACELTVEDAENRLELSRVLGRALESERVDGERAAAAIRFVRSQYPETAKIEADGLIAVTVNDLGDPFVNIGLVSNGCIVHIVQQLTPEQYQRVRSYVLGQTRDTFDSISEVLRTMNAKGGIAAAGR